MDTIFNRYVPAFNVFLLLKNIYNLYEYIEWVKTLIFIHKTKGCPLSSDTIF